MNQIFQELLSPDHENFHLCAMDQHWQSQLFLANPWEFLHFRDNQHFPTNYIENQFHNNNIDHNSHRNNRYPQTLNDLFSFYSHPMSSWLEQSQQNCYEN